jgi:hypothetical protein
MNHMTIEETAYKKGRAAGMAASRRKSAAGKPAPRKGPKQYRMKKPIVQVKQAIGKFQHKHPYISAALTSAGLIGVGAGAAQKAGLPAFDRLKGIKKIPIAGKIYHEVADSTKIVLDRVIR